jgi:hypothetical protein
MPRSGRGVAKIRKKVIIGLQNSNILISGQKLTQRKSIEVTERHREEIYRKVLSGTLCILCDLCVTEL